MTKPIRPEHVVTATDAIKAGDKLWMWLTDRLVDVDVVCARRVTGGWRLTLRGASGDMWDRLTSEGDVFHRWFKTS